mgnify:CR=1 FL=1
MKKSVIILIALIYVASIAIVGFLGLKAKSYNDVIYLESFEILSEYKVDIETGSKYLVFIPTSDGDRSIRLETRVYPENASDKKIIYALEKDCTVAAVDENGVVTFNENITNPVSVKVYIYANQNPTISDEILIYYVP